MSFVAPRRCTFRLSRSVLYAIAHLPETFEAIAASDADVVLFELEDAVPLDAKTEARENVIAALGDLDWTNKSVTVRVNALDSPFTYQDVIALLESPSADVIDTLFLPKAGVAADVYAFDVLVTQVERSVGRSVPVGFDLMVESAQGLTNIAEIAAASPRVESLQFGSFDYARSTRMTTTIVGGPHPQYVVPSAAGDVHWNDPYHFPIAQIVAAARSAGVRPIDGPYVADLSNLDADQEGFITSAQRARVLGCDGKQTLTAGQAALANEAFTPTDDELSDAQAVVEAASGAMPGNPISLNGQNVDQSTVFAAQDIVAKAEAIAART